MDLNQTQPMQQASPPAVRQPLPQQAPVTQPVASAPLDTSQPPHKKNSPFLLMLIIFLVILILAGAGYFFLTNKPQPAAVAPVITQPVVQPAAQPTVPVEQSDAQLLQQVDIGSASAEIETVQNQVNQL